MVAEVIDPVMGSFQLSFTDAERAALALSEAVTRLSDRPAL
jgi:hypothetical protein